VSADIDVDVESPASIERKLMAMGRQIYEAHNELVRCEETYWAAKADLEIELARARLAVGSRYLEMGTKVTVQEREDEATDAVADKIRAMYTAEAVVRAARANAARLRTQTDILRSVGSSVRNSMEMP
jgi:hypothetical protein